MMESGVVDGLGPRSVPIAEGLEVALYPFGIVGRRQEIDIARRSQAHLFVDAIRKVYTLEEQN